MKTTTSVCRAAAVLAACVLAMVVLSAVPAETAEPDVPQDFDALLEAFDITDQPIDFVVVVDISQSMADGADPLYPQVKQAYEEFVGAMRPDDHLSVVTFGADDEVTVTPLDPVGPTDDRADAIAALPDSANGSATDIGEAIRSTLERLERPNGNEVQVVLFLTDGQHRPDDSSDFPSTTGGQWDVLTDQAVAIEGGHQVLVRGAGLTNGRPTDIGLLNNVFTDAEIVNLSPDRIDAYFQETVDRSRVEVLRAAVNRELENTVRVVEVGDQRLDDPSLLTVELASGLEHLPVEVSVDDVTVTDADGQEVDARLVDGSQQFLVAPGERSPEIEVEVEGLDFDEDTRWFPQTTQSQDLQVDLTTTAVAQPDEVLERILGLSDTAVEVTPLADPLDVSRTDGLTWATLLRLLAVLAVLLLIAYLLYWRFVQLPPLRGCLQYPPDRKTSVPLAGTSQVFPNKRYPSLEAGTARAEFFTRRGKRNKVYVRTKERTVQVQHETQRKRLVPLTGERRVRANDHLRIGAKEVVYSAAKAKKGK